MKKLGIIQPGKIGDIIICLPIAKWYHDRGWTVIWPVDRNIIDNFLGYVDYVTFFPIDFNCLVASQFCYKQFCNKIIDLSFTIPGANEHNSSWYLKENDEMSFDQLKYHIAEVPFEEKYNLVITRNHDNEHDIYEQIWAGKTFILTQLSSSDQSVAESFLNKFDKGDNVFIPITNLTKSVFDWLTVIELSNGVILIESCFTNLIDQLNITDLRNKYLIMKKNYYGKTLKDGHPKGLPRLQLDWNKIYA